MTTTPFEEFLIEFEAATPAERLRAMDWILPNRSDDKTSLDPDELAARAGIPPEQSARLKRAVAEGMAYRTAQND